MKIRFLKITGKVAVDDRFSMSDATAGMILDTSLKTT